MFVLRGDDYVAYPGTHFSKEEGNSRLYHYTNINSFEMIWEHKTLKFSNVINVNDIIESNYSVISNQVANIPLLDEYISKRNSYKQISLCMDSDTYELGCMSPMMWGQYAQNGNGVCVEFNFGKLSRKIKPSMLVGPVKYVKMLPTPPVLNEKKVDWDSFFVSHAEDIFFTKHYSWERENEFKIVSNKDDFLDISQTITAIYVAKKNEETIRRVSTLLTKEDDISFNIVGTGYINEYFLITINNINP